MSDLLTTIEEMDVNENIKEPHLSYVIATLQERKKVVYSVFQRKETDLLLIDSSGFLIDSVFAGLTEKHIEYIAKNAPKNYKQNLLKILQDAEMMKGVFEIAVDMDTDIGKNITQNQDRVKNVIQYIKDNKMVFEF